MQHVRSGHAAPGRYLRRSIVSGMLTGSDLHAKVKELGDVSKSDLMRAGGTMSAKKAGRERLNFTAFDEGMFEANGLNFGSTGSAGSGSGGRRLRSQGLCQPEVAGCRR
jgi:hypothetical protein